MTERDLTPLCVAAAKAFTTTTDEEWDAAPPLVKYEVMAAILPVVQAVLNHMDAAAPASDTDYDEWAAFLAGH